MNVDPKLLAALPLLLRVEIEENVQRKEFTQSELADIQLTLIDHLSSHKNQGQRNDLTCTEKPVQVDAPARRENSTEQVARIFGESERTVRNRIDVVQAAAAEPDNYGSLLDQMNRTGRVSGVHKRLRIRQQAEAIAQEPPPLPDGPFRVLVVDPPWKYNRDSDPSHRGSTPYPTMSIQDICELKVADISGEDSLIWLWTTNTHIRESFTVLDAWGFEYKTMLTWVKPRMGTGEWLRGQTEHCLLAAHGRPTIVLSNQTTVLQGATGRHSEKPEEFYKLVECLCPGSKVELFARRRRAGWEAHGNEVQGDQQS